MVNNYNIDSIISECIEREIVRTTVEDIIREELDIYAGNYLMEKKSKKNKSKKKKSDKKSEKGSSKANQRRNAVMNMLKDGRFLHSYLSYRLWHPKDQSEKDTCRSLFAKMANGTPDADGNIRQFSDKEITKLYQIMMKKR